MLWWLRDKHGGHFLDHQLPPHERPVCMKALTQLSARAEGITAVTEQWSRNKVAWRGENAGHVRSRWNNHLNRPEGKAEFVIDQKKHKEKLKQQRGSLCETVCLKFQVSILLFSLH